MKSATRFLYGLLKFLIPVAIVAVGAFAGWKLMSAREGARKSDRAVTAKYVEVVPVASTSRPIVTSAFGTVRAHRSLTVQAQVQGLVTEQHPKLNQGAILNEGDLLCRIDGRDYEATIAQESAALTTAKFNLKVEEGRQVVAEREWRLLEGTVESSELSQELALRKPHLEEKRAAVTAAQSRLDRAKLDLARTELRVPFHALVLEESVEVGQLVTAQSVLARLVGIDEFHIEVSVGVSDLQWVQLPDSEHAVGSKVRVIQELGIGQRLEREGFVVGLLGEVDPTGRMARVLVEVPDPLGLEGGDDAAFPLLVGEYVTVEIEGPTLSDIVAVPRTGMREGSKVWVMDRDQRLAMRTVERIFSTRNEVVVKNTFEPGDAVIISALQVPLPGMLLTTTVAAPTSAAGGSAASE